MKHLLHLGRAHSEDIIIPDINNVGLIAQALIANGNPDYDDVKAAQLQALQVSTISIMNCSGRILIG